MSNQPYQARNKVRLVTAASLFDGHDAAINVIRRVLQSVGAEVIHLGHDRSVAEIVEAAIEEDVQGIAISSYQGGHLEYFKYLRDLLVEQDAPEVAIFGGGGGVIVPEEIAELEAYGISKIFSPEDGRRLGLKGMAHYVLERCDRPTITKLNGEITRLSWPDTRNTARLISYLEHAATETPELAVEARGALDQSCANRRVPVLGVTGTGGAGKSSLVDELVLRARRLFPELKIGIVSVDPTKRKTGGALLGDRIRMNAIGGPQVQLRSLATRRAHASLSTSAVDAVRVFKAAGADLVILETAGIGQADSEVAEFADLSLYVMTPEYGASSQLEKIDMLDYADVVAINKSDKRGALDAERDVKKQLRRNREQFDGPDSALPVFSTIASQFNDPGTTRLFQALLSELTSKHQLGISLPTFTDIADKQRMQVIPGNRTRYLAEIAEGSRARRTHARTQAGHASRAYALSTTLRLLGDTPPAQGQDYAPDAVADQSQTISDLRQRYTATLDELDKNSRELLSSWEATRASFRTAQGKYRVRKREIEVPNFTETLSQTQIPKVALPNYSDWGDLLYWRLMENTPGSFPYTAGVYPYKRSGEDPTRMFAGEGTPERTNKRFHYVSHDQPAKRLSTAFDSVTLYGQDPAPRPDIYGKIGNSGVSVATLDDAKRLYSGFDLSSPKTSVSMTINGPAPMILAMFMNTAIDQQVESYLKEKGELDAARSKVRELYTEQGLEAPRYRASDLPRGHSGHGTALLGLSGDNFIDAETYQRIKTETMKAVRGTVQADILKEDQAQNTCIFSTEFALRMMGDIQEHFSNVGVRNFYSVSISGYHIAEAGANPITQTALTLANGFTFVEYYLSRGMDIDSFAPNLSFFFSNGLDAEYAVIGRVARRIWATAMRERYAANERSQMLKYHIQTSGRSLHAQEVQFNDIRTTLQALFAIYDNCNSLHTNAYDEAITTPTEESVRRAIAIQLIINNELGTAKNENPNQGAFIVDELTDLVEEAVLKEFERLSERGGVLGAMETMYQRSKIQEESLHYEELKHSGELPIVGVNTYLAKNEEQTEQTVRELIRSSDEEKQEQLKGVTDFQAAHADEAPKALARLQQVATEGGNLFEELLETVKVASLGQISVALYEVGGKYRRSM